MGDFDDEIKESMQEQQQQPIDEIVVRPVAPAKLPKWSIGRQFKYGGRKKDYQGDVTQFRGVQEQSAFKPHLEYFAQGGRLNFRPQNFNEQNFKDMARTFYEAGVPEEDFLWFIGWEAKPRNVYKREGASFVDAGPGEANPRANQARRNKTHYGKALQSRERIGLPKTSPDEKVVKRPVRLDPMKNNMRARSIVAETWGGAAQKRDSASPRPKGVAEVLQELELLPEHGLQGLEPPADAPPPQVRPIPKPTVQERYGGKSIKEVLKELELDE